jgi:hypothetical protein
MKKYLILIATAIIFFSCKKENAGTIVNNNPVLSKTLYPVEFNYSLSNATGTTSKTATNSLSTTALKDQIKYLRYFVYSGPLNLSILKYVKQKTQKPTDTNFGFITDSLPAGQYSIFFVGAQAPGDFSNERKAGANVYGLPVFYYNNSKIYDTFIKTVELTITDKVNQSVVLTRITSMITFKLNDIMPANAATVKVSFEDFPLGIDLVFNQGKSHAEGEPYPTATFSFPVKDTDKGKTGFTLSTLVWPYNWPSLNIDCIGLNGELLAHRELTRAIPLISENANYIFSGKLFDQQANFPITIDDQWNPPVNLPLSLPSQTQ